MFIAAVTGTNGKTSTAEFTAQLLRSDGLRVACASTLGLQIDSGRRERVYIRMDGSGFRRFLDRLHAERVDALVLEAHSAGLARRRYRGLLADAAAFTTFGRDHLDQHRTLARYRAAKDRLFTEHLKDGGSAVLNSALPAIDAITSSCRSRGIERVLYGSGPGADVRLRGFAAVDDGVEVALDLAGRPLCLRLPPTAPFMAENVLCALALARAAGTDVVGTLRDAPRALHPPPGRLEHVVSIDGADVFIDYAHSPDSLRRVLDSLRGRTRGVLVLVFGCGGERDPGKRPEMGRVAHDLADQVIVTDDNPRGEAPAGIRRTILRGCPSAVEIPNRREAIRYGMSALRAGDTLLVAGRGAETHQLRGRRAVPFSDREVISG